MINTRNAPKKRTNLTSTINYRKKMINTRNALIKPKEKKAYEYHDHDQ